MIFTERVTDITYQKIMPAIVDWVNNSNVFAAMVFEDMLQDWEGVTMNFPITVANSTTGGSFDGMDTWSTAATNNTRQAVFYVKAYEQSVVVPGLERVVNAKSERQALSLMATRMDEAKVSMSQGIGILFGGVGSGKDFEGRGNIIDNGTNAATYGGLTRASVSGANADVTAVTAGTITLDYLSTEFDNVSAASSAQESPTIGYTTKQIWTFVEGLIMPTLSSRYEATQIGGYNKVSGKTPVGTSVPAGSPELKGAAGFNAITYRGRPLVADDNADTGVFDWLNQHYLAFYRAVDSELQQISSGVEVTEGFYEDVPMPSSWLQFREMMSPVNQYGEIGALLLIGNLICRQPRRFGKLTGVTTN